MYERAVAVVEKAYGRDNAALADNLAGLANALMSLGRAAQAREYAERAVGINEARGAAAIDLADSRFALARVLWELGGDRTRARWLANQARDGYSAAGPGASKQLAKVNDWLAGIAGR